MYLAGSFLIFYFVLIAMFHFIVFGGLCKILRLLHLNEVILADPGFFF
jgi:hypothetical protein